MHGTDRRGLAPCTKTPPKRFTGQQRVSMIGAGSELLSA